jgi:hypothetical protein
MAEVEKGLGKGGGLKYSAGTCVKPKEEDQLIISLI